LTGAKLNLQIITFLGPIGSLDTFLNDPPPGFRKNSFQFTAGLTYALK
jgi:hypothetical protein